MRNGKSEKEKKENFSRANLRKITCIMQEI